MYINIDKMFPSPSPAAAAQTLGDTELRLLLLGMSREVRTSYIRTQQFGEKERCHRILLLDDVGVFPSSDLLEAERAGRKAERIRRAVAKANKLRRQAEAVQALREDEAMGKIPMVERQVRRSLDRASSLVEALGRSVDKATRALAQLTVRGPPRFGNPGNVSPWRGARAAAADLVGSQEAMNAAKVEQKIRLDACQVATATYAAASALHTKAAAVTDAQALTAVERLHLLYQCDGLAETVAKGAKVELDRQRDIWLDDEALLRLECSHIRDTSCECPSTKYEVQLHLLYFVAAYPNWQDMLAHGTSPLLVEAASAVPQYDVSSDSEGEEDEGVDD